MLRGNALRNGNTYLWARKRTSIALPSWSVLGFAGEWGTKVCPWEMPAYFLFSGAHLEDDRAEHIFIVLLQLNHVEGVRTQLSPVFPSFHFLSP